MTFDPDAYLDRLALARPPATAEGLAALQQAQLRAIAFENLDPLTGRLPDLAPAALWRKLVEDRRGGYCFELNGLFGAALAAFGFAARPVLARVRMGAAEGGARTHLAFVVTIGGREWLADSGFGGSGPRVPLALDAALHDDGRDRFRIRRDGEERVVEKAGPEGWFGLYGFDGYLPRPIDVEAANVVSARWERAPFGSNLMLSRQLPDGRVSCQNRNGRTDRAGGLELWTLGSAADLHRRLTGDFGIAASAELAAAAWARLPA
jgi:N-hydroxyarylamine O-acetyltransferase